MTLKSIIAINVLLLISIPSFGSSSAYTKCESSFFYQPKGYYLGYKYAESITGESDPSQLISFVQAYLKDPRYLGFIDPEITDGISQLAHVLKVHGMKEPNKMVLDSSDTQIKGEAPPRIDEMRAVGVTPLVTWNMIGYPALNLLISKGFWPLILTDQHITLDGEPYSPGGAFHHDILHWGKKLYESTNETHQVVINFFLDYINQVQDLTPSERILFDLAYFLIFHEIGGFSEKDLESLKKVLNSNPTEQTSIELFSFLKVSFDSLSKVTTEFLLNTIITDRVMDPEDLGGLLPSNVFDFIKKSDREAGRRETKQYIEKALSLFFEKFRDFPNNGKN